METTLMRGGWLSPLDRGKSMNSLINLISAVAIVLTGAALSLVLVRLSVFGELKTLRQELSALRARNDTLNEINVKLQRDIWDRDKSIALLESQVLLLQTQVSLLGKGEIIG